MPFSTSDFSLCSLSFCDSEHPMDNIVMSKINITDCFIWCFWFDNEGIGIDKLLIYYSNKMVLLYFILYNSYITLCIT